MRIVAVHAAVREQAPQMEVAVVFPAVIHRGHQRFVLKKVSVLDGLRDPGQILKDDPSRAHVHMAHLRVAHLPVGKSHVKT